MKCTCCTGLHLAAANPCYVIEVHGKRFNFEMHPWSGPFVLTKSGDVAKRQPRPLHAFWTAVTHWHQQGKRLDANNLCVWDAPAEPELVHLGSRNYTRAGSDLANKYASTP